jgi:hypothetical protein
MRNILALFVLTSSLEAQAQDIRLVRENIRECEPVAVKFSGFPVVQSRRGNWLSIVDADMPDNQQLYRFVYLPSSSSGRVELPTKGLMPFKAYEIRAYLDWDGTRSWDVVARVDFGVMPNRNCKKAMINSVAGIVDAGTPLQFSFSGVVDSASNWVAIAKPTQTNPNFLKTKYLQQETAGDGVIDTTGLEPGEYELRLFEDWAKTKEYFLQSSVRFTIR